MKAWQFTDTHQPLVLTEAPEPTAGPGEVVVDVRAAGLCHSDVGMLTDPDWLSTLAKRPITLGHEVAGVVSEVGPDVSGWEPGDRVGLCPTTQAGAPGYAFEGGFAPRLAVPTPALVRLPEAVDFTAGAVGTDAGMTSHHAVVTNGGVGPDMKVGIIGLGGLGQIGARVGVLAGAEVFVAEINESVWPLAERIGVTRVAHSITDFAHEMLDVVIDFAGFGSTTAKALEVVRMGGRVVQVGMGRLEATISTKSLILSKVTLVGSNGGTPEDVASVYDVFASGDLTPTITEIDFDEIPAGLARLERGEVTGRLAARMAA